VNALAGALAAGLHAGLAFPTMMTLLPMPRKALRTPALTLCP